MCGPCVVVCGDFEIFQSSLCVGPVLWCVGTLKFFKVPCVCGPCVVVCEDLEFFQSSSVCGLCAVVCGDFEFFKVPLCVKLCPCTGEIEFSQKIPVLGIFPCAGEIGFFGSKSLCWGFFPGGGAVRPQKKTRCSISGLNM